MNLTYEKIPISDYSDGFAKRSCLLAPSFIVLVIRTVAHKIKGYRSCGCDQGAEINYCIGLPTKRHYAKIVARHFHAILLPVFEDREISYLFFSLSESAIRVIQNRIDAIPFKSKRT